MANLQAQFAREIHESDLTTNEALTVLNRVQGTMLNFMLKDDYMNETDDD